MWVWVYVCVHLFMTRCNTGGRRTKEGNKVINQIGRGCWVTSCGKNTFIILHALLTPRATYRLYVGVWIGSMKC